MTNSLRIPALAVAFCLVACGADESPWNLGIGGKGEYKPGEPIEKGSILVQQAATTKSDRSLGVDGPGFGLDHERLPYENGFFYVLRESSTALYPIEVSGAPIYRYQMGTIYPFPVGQYSLVTNNTRIDVQVKAGEQVVVYAGRIEQPEGAYFTVEGETRFCIEHDELKVPTTHGIDVLPAHLDPNIQTGYEKTVYGSADQELGKYYVTIANRP